MKRSLIALAVLGTFAGLASAQSSVTLSGGVDLGVRRVGGEWNMGTAGSSRTNFTLSGSEDLGGGMSAFFLLNHRFNANNGTLADSPRFYRQSWVGLKGGFGDVRLGRFLPPVQEYNGDFDPFGTDTVGSTHTGGISSGTTNSRINNAIRYGSPNMGGLTFIASIAAGDENGAGGTSGKERPVGFGVNYAAGPLRVAAAYDRNGSDLKTIGVYGSYNAGFATLMAQFEKGDTTPTVDVKRYSIGALVPMGAATIKAGYMNWKDEDKKKVGLGVDYALSKRTNLYSDVGKQSGNGFTATQKKAMFDLGIRHKF